MHYLSAYLIYLVNYWEIIIICQIKINSLHSSFTTACYMLYISPGTNLCENFKGVQISLHIGYMHFGMGILNYNLIHLIFLCQLYAVLIETFVAVVWLNLNDSLLTQNKSINDKMNGVFFPYPTLPSEIWIYDLYVFGFTNHKQTTTHQHKWRKVIPRH